MFSMTVTTKFDNIVIHNILNYWPENGRKFNESHEQKILAQKTYIANKWFNSLRRKHNAVQFEDQVSMVFHGQSPNTFIQISGSS